jgi:N-acetylmuramoyl-L-alanine amidase
MPGPSRRKPAARHAEPDSISRRRFVRVALVLGLVPAGAAAIDWFARHGVGAPAVAGNRPVAGLHSASPSASISPRPALPLAGKVVVIDPGHNPHNPDHVAEINSLVSAGGFLKACDTVGTQTDAGYPEYDFTLDVARQARVILRAAGAKVILTQNGRTAYGPCVNIRAAIGNRAPADAAVAIHADGGPPGGYGFAILVPELIQNTSTDNSPIIEPSHRLAEAMVRHFAAVTGQNLSTYLGANGIQPRNDLAGLNLSTVPKVFIECANMRNARDAVKVTSPRWRQLAAQSIADSISAFLAAG